MAKVDRVKVGVKFVKNLGQYESLHLEAGAELIVEEGDKPKDVFSKAYEMCDMEISQQLKDFEAVKKKGR